MPHYGACSVVVTAQYSNEVAGWKGPQLAQTTPAGRPDQYIDREKTGVPTDQEQVASCWESGENWQKETGLSSPT